MEFELPDELKLVRDVARRFVDQELIPLETKLADLSEIPEDIRVHLESKVKEIGFWAAAVPTEYGGGGIGTLGNIVLREQIARSILGDIRNDRGFGGRPWPILYSCNPEQRKKFLDPVVAGQKKQFFAMTEPGAGNDANSIATRAVLEGESWVINGSKAFISHVERADFGVVIARTSQDERARNSLSAFLVETNAPGFAVTHKSGTMGAARVFELHFDNCRIPKENLLGAVGQGMELAGKNLTQTRLFQTALSLGSAQRALELTIDYAQQRQTFGKFLKDRGAVQAMLADSAAELRSARLLAYTLAHRLDRGEDPTTEVAAAKIWAGECGSRILDRAIQIHGGAGVTQDLPFERMYRDQRSLRITEGGAEVQRWVIARSLIRQRQTPPPREGS